ncbi:tetratricopeptide repeat protein 23 isoform X2 [Boleophthalmus pectinirostris]|uniref:tetratricopeptide repeat protein 23 isoform X2 n=1 Tax=Boleophthalmus pectinirostris TaxID=150288 RepID=UPI00242BF4F4|nr:tetratricopeptide repeat protein 23 isoform X2 [Boleophthalmus pectinirostris]
MDSSSGGEELSGSPPLPQTSKTHALMSPEEKLQHYDISAQAHEDSKQDLVRCLALVKLVYGKNHLKLAQAHSRLAKAYLQFKDWGVQALEHVSSARQVLLLCSGDRHELRLCLLNLCLIQGQAALLTDNVCEAESAFLQAEQQLGPLCESRALLQEQSTQTELEVCTGLFRVYRRQGKPKEALSQCERSLQLLRDMNQEDMTWSVYRDMSHIQEDQGNVDTAIDLMSKAHSIALTRTPPRQREGAGLSHRLALLMSTSANSQHNESAGDYFEQSLSLYRSSAGERDLSYLSAQDDYCRYLLLRGQHEKCVELQRASLSSKRAQFGELSAGVADTLQLIASVEMSKGELSQAYRSMSQCLEIQSVLFGPQHKKTRATQKAVDMLARTPEVSERLRRRGQTKVHLNSSALSPDDI